MTEPATDGRPARDLLTGSDCSAPSGGKTRGRNSGIFHSSHLDRARAENWERWPGTVGTDGRNLEDGMSSRGKARRHERKAQQAAARRDARKGVRVLTMLVAAAVVLVAIAAVVFRDGSRPPPPRPGAVWSAEHGHWH